MSNLNQKSLNQTDESILDSILGPVRENSHTLDTFTPIDEMPNEQPWTFIKQAYKERNLESRVIACLTNRIATARRQFFFISLPLLQEYVVNDPHLERKTFEGKEAQQLFRRLLARLNNNEAFLKCLIPPSKGRLGEKNRSGLYTLSNQNLINLLNWWDVSLAAPIMTPIIPPIETPTKNRISISIEKNKNKNKIEINNKYKTEFENWIKNEFKYSSEEIDTFNHIRFNSFYALYRWGEHGKIPIGFLEFHKNKLRDKYSLHDESLNINDRYKLFEQFYSKYPEDLQFVDDFECTTEDDF